MGAALSERQLGWNSREVVSRPPLDDFPGLRPEHTGCRGQIVCYISDRQRRNGQSPLKYSRLKIMAVRYVLAHYLGSWGVGYGDNHIF